MRQIATLSTRGLEVVGDTIDAEVDPPVLLAEDTYIVRALPGATVRSGLSGALRVLPGAKEGQLRFGNFVGLAELDGRIIRVDSRRMSLPEADAMLRNLVETLQKLPARALSSTGAAFDRTLQAGEEIDLLAYLVVRDAVRGKGPHDLTTAMSRVLSRPNERLVDERRVRPIWSADRIDGGTLVDMVAPGFERIRVPADSPLSGSPVTVALNDVLPLHIRVGGSTPTTDTLENRFLATVLDRCLAIVRTVVAHAARDVAPAMEPLRAEAVQLATTLERWRLHRVLRDLTPLKRLPTTSTVLRGRPGYRDVFRFYADLLGRTRIVPPSAAMRIVGLRDVATLYEWWCFFQVVGIASEVLGAPLKIDPATQGWQGAELGQGLTAHFSSGVRVEFNRRFARTDGDDHRSYSVPLRPDIVVETPDTRHLFDAKFAFEPLATSVDEDDDAGVDHPDVRARRAHIHKMHTYRDAVDGVSSVRVLYPGSTGEWYPVETSGGPRQGVGSVPLRVGSAADAQALRSLIEVLIGSDRPICRHDEDVEGVPTE